VGSAVADQRALRLALPPAHLRGGRGHHPVAGAASRACRARAEADRIAPDLAARRSGSRRTLSRDRRPDRPACGVDDAPPVDDTRSPFGTTSYGAARLRRGRLALGGRRLERWRGSRSRLGSQPARRPERDGAGARNPDRRDGARTLPRAGDAALDGDEDRQSRRRALPAHDGSRPIVVLERRVDGTVGIGNKAPPEDTP